MTKEILAVAKHQLATQGPSGVALRAVAREVGMVSSAIYRYFPSRDDLLTALIVEAYEDLADAIEEGERKQKRADLRGRWIAAGRAVRQWGIDHPHQYGLIYGTPIPDYRAPEATIAPVIRATGVMVAILADGLATNALETVPHPLSTAAKRSMSAVRKTYPDIPPEVLASGLSAWIHLLGLVSFELFGHMNNVIESPAAFYDNELHRLADLMLGVGS